MTREEIDLKLTYAIVLQELACRELIEVQGHQSVAQEFKYRFNRMRKQNELFNNFIRSRINNENKDDEERFDDLVDHHYDLGQELQLMKHHKTIDSVTNYAKRLRLGEKNIKDE